MRIFYVFFLLVFFFLLRSGTVYAGTDFLAHYDISYAVSPSGKTIVTENISLINKTTGIYPKQYAITLDSLDISNVIAYDPKGVVAVEVKKNDGKTSLLLTFNTKVVGLDKTLPFSLRFETDSVARKIGSIWEVTLPAVPNDPSIGEYNVRLSVPDSFGQNAYVSPPPLDGLRWNKELLSHGGVTAAYGEKQVYTISLLYHLFNTLQQEKSMTITLPPDTAYQQILISSLEPEAQKVERDRDGNWLASYPVGPREKKTVTANIVATVYPYPRDSYGRDSVHPLDYLSERPYWEVSNPSILALAQTYKTPEDIYRYVSTSLSYDYSRVSLGTDRFGAVGALNNPGSALCNEFTDLFIALSRASGIAARRVVGYGYTTNPRIRPLSLVVDVLHTWPEYFDEKLGRWISIDPTWANTTGGVDYFKKLDFSHIAFAINGLSSEEPRSAGMYKDVSNPSKDVTVSLSSIYPSDLAVSSLHIVFRLPHTAIGGTTVKGNLDIRNSTGVSAQIEGVKVESLSHLLSVSSRETEIPPFGNISIPIEYPIPRFPSVGRDILTVRAGNSMKQTEIAYISYGVIGGAILSALGIIILFIVITVIVNRNRK